MCNFRRKLSRSEHGVEESTTAAVESTTSSAGTHWRSTAAAYPGPGVPYRSRRGRLTLAATLAGADTDESLVFLIPSITSISMDGVESSGLGNGTNSDGRGS